MLALLGGPFVLLAIRVFCRGCSTRIPRGIVDSLRITPSADALLWQLAVPRWFGFLAATLAIYCAAGVAVCDILIGEGPTAIVAPVLLAICIPYVLVMDRRRYFLEISWDMKEWFGTADWIAATSFYLGCCLLLATDGVFHFGMATCAFVFMLGRVALGWESRAEVQAG